MNPWLLGIDIGGTVVKAGLFDPAGRQRAVCRQAVPADMPQPGWVEIDADRLWQATADLVARTLQQANVRPADVAAVACTGHGNGLYLVDDSGRPTRPAIASSDSRARPYVQQWQQQGLIDRLRPLTLQSNWPAQPNALLRWLADHEPHTLARSRWALMCKDFVRMQLTGRALAELTDYSATSLLNVPANDYDDRLFEAFSIAHTRRLMPPLIGPTDPAGTVTDQAARRTGLAAGTPVFAGAFDIDACGLAAGCTDPSTLVMVGGTWGNNQFLTDQPLCSADLFMVSRYALPDYYLVLEGSATSASNLQWLVDLLFDDPRRADRQVFDQVNQWVQQTPPAEDRPLFLPFLYACPLHPDGRGAFVGLTGRTDRAELARAVFEGVCFMHHWHYDRLMRFRDRPQAITMTGGIARSIPWCQLFADAFDRPILVPAAEELGALGAAIIAAVGCGLHPDLPAACSAMTRLARSFTPDPARHEIYQRRYRRFLQVARQLVGPPDP